MGGKEPRDASSADDYEFYLADDLQELDLDPDEDEPTPNTGQPIARTPARRSSLVSRARMTKTMTAQEALAAALAEEERKEKAALARRLAQEAAKRAAEDRRRQERAADEEQAEWARAAFGNAQRPGVPVAGTVGRKTREPKPEIPGLPDEARVVARYEVVPEAVVRPLMQAHQARAQQDGDLAGVVSFAAVQRAIDSGVPLRACRVEFDGKQWAVWMAAGVPVAVLEPADLYLVGVS